MNTSQRRQGFTLIELLVVIAIIAILAAILFPVFAQAKMAAKKTVMVSGMKQNLLGFAMYQNDNDDYFPLKAIIGYSTTEPAITWDKTVQPYLKSYAILMSSEDGRQKYDSPYGKVRRSFGIAHNLIRGVAVNPTYGWGANLNWQSINSSYVSQPSGTVMLGLKPQPAYTDSAIWNKIDWQDGHGIYTTRRSNMPSTDPRAKYGEILSVYSDGTVWGYVDGSARYMRVNGFASDGMSHGYKIPGYQEGAYGYLNDKYWDQGVVCMDWPWRSTDAPGHCTIPGE
jgi:prepilin-type N-terminal cleavage/methylation domain-containing protein